MWNYIFYRSSYNYIDNLYTIGPCTIRWLQIQISIYNSPGVKKAYIFVKPHLPIRLLKQGAILKILDMTKKNVLCQAIVKTSLRQTCQIKVSEQGKLLTRLQMMVASSGVRKAVLVCLTIYFFTVATGFSVISYHAKAILMQAHVSRILARTLGPVSNLCSFFLESVAELMCLLIDFSFCLTFNQKYLYRRWNNFSRLANPLMRIWASSSLVFARWLEILSAPSSLIKWVRVFGYFWGY